MKLIVKSLFIIALCPFLAHAQFYNCANPNYDFLKNALGEWTVQTTDRVAIGQYESNQGKATISNAIAGCGIDISFDGIYKGKPYARKAIITGIDSINIQMVSMDSEHGGFLTYEGQLADEKLELVWYRDQSVGRLRSKYELHFKDESQFEFSSYLSTDHGETWALTHQRIFSKATSKPRTNFFAIIVKDIDSSIKWYSDASGFDLINLNRIESKGLSIANLISADNKLELIQIDSSLSPSDLIASNQRMQGLFKVGFTVDKISPYISKLKKWNPDFDESVVTDLISNQSMIVFRDPDGNRIQLFEAN